jgi:hypothetical protein
MNRICVRSILMIAIIAALGLSSGLSVFAQTSDTATPSASGTPESTTPSDKIWFILTPKGEVNGSFFDVKASPGESVTVSATIGNGSEIPVTAIMYAADAYSGTNGGFILNDNDKPITDPTTWLDFPTTTYDFNPKEGFEQDFTVTVPEGTPPGQYITGLAVETVDAAPMKGDAPLLVKYRFAAAVLITVPGDVSPGFDIGEINAEVEVQTTISGVIENTGNVRVRPEGTLTLTDSMGVKVVAAPITMQSVYAGDTTTFEIILPTPIPEGDYIANVDLKDPDTGSTASLSDVAVTVVKPVAAAPVSITNVDISPMPSADEVVFAQVSVTIGNSGSPLSGGEVTIQVFRDGEQVDDHVLATAMIIQNGDSIVDQTYIPESGKWEPGTYSFQITLTTTDPTSGTTSTVATVMSDQTIVVK